jgi:hypothetical protein
MAVRAFSPPLLRNGFALQRSGLKTIPLHRSNGVLIKGTQEGADHDKLLGLALHVDDAGYDKLPFLSPRGNSGSGT